MELNLLYIPVILSLIIMIISPPAKINKRAKTNPVVLWIIPAALFVVTWGIAIVMYIITLHLSPTSWLLITTSHVFIIAYIFGVLYVRRKMKDSKEIDKMRVQDLE